jgi:hypothetical protein
MKKNATCIIVVLLSVLLLTSCMDKEAVTTCLKGDKYGFWGGLWHGFIAPFNFIMMLFWENNTIYSFNNNGPWYAFGFLLGSGGWGFFGGRGLARKHRH